MARPMRAAGLWNPKAIRVMTLILVFTDSMRPLLRPCSRVAWMLGGWLPGSAGPAPPVDLTRPHRRRPGPGSQHGCRHARARRPLTGNVLVGHNIGVDWRLLHRRCPGIRPGALLDTLRLARHLRPGAKGNGLTALLERYQLTGTVTSLAPGSQPHRALWDAVGTALLLAALIGDLPETGDVTLARLCHLAGYPGDGNHQSTATRRPRP